MEKKNVKFEDVVYFQEGPGVRNWQFRASGIKLINIRNLVDSKLCLENTMNYLEIEEVENKYKHFLLNAGDFVMASSGVTWGKIAEVHEEHLPLCLNTSIIRLASKDTDVIDKWYLYYFIKSPQFRRQIERLITGSAQPNFGPSHLKKVVINLPEICNQREAIEQFTKVEGIIDKRQKEMELLDDLIKARFVEMFGDENNSFGWDIVNVEDIADVQVGVVIKPAQYYTDSLNGIKTFRSLNVGPMYIKDNDWVYFTEEGNNKNAKSILKENDLLIVRSGAPGTACVVSKEYEGCNAIDIIIAHPHIDKINPHYLCAYTNFPHGKKQIEEGTGGAAQQHFNLGKYNKLKLMLPPMDKQEEFVAFMNQVGKSKFATQKYIKVKYTKEVTGYGN